MWKPVLPTNRTRLCKQILGESFGVKMLHKKEEFLTGLRSLKSMVSQNLNSKGIADTYSGRRASARTKRNINGVWTSVGRSPKKLLPRRSQELRTSRESLRRVFKSDLHLYPYQIQVKQKLTEADLAKRIAKVNGFVTQSKTIQTF